jgi:hypothetical protein
MAHFCDCKYEIIFSKTDALRFLIGKKIEINDIKKAPLIINEAFKKEI